MEEKFLQSYSVNSGAKLEVQNLNGNINITGWANDVIEIEAIKKISDFSEGILAGMIKKVIEVTSGNPENEKYEFENVVIEVKNDQDAIFVETKYLKKNSKIAVNYEIKVPSNIMVCIVDNSNGKISLENTFGDSNIKTSNGSIYVKNVKGIIKAYSSNGNIFVNAPGISSLETSNGHIEAEISEIKNDIDIKTSNGKITLNISSDINADVQLKTSNGKVSVSESEITKSHSSSNNFEGRIGTGGCHIRAVTNNGKIELVYKKKALLEANKKLIS